MNKTAPRAGRNNHRAKPNLSFRAQNYKKMMKSDTKTMFFVLFVAKNGKMIILSTHPAMPSEAPPQPSPREGTEKLKPTIKLKVDDGDIAVLPFIFCLF